MDYSDLVIRKTSVDDKAGILVIANDIFLSNDAMGLETQLNNYYKLNGYSGLRLSSDIVRREGILISQEWYSFVKPEGVIGFTGLESHNFDGPSIDVAWLNWTGIKREYKKNGIGGIMMNHVQARAKELGFKQLGVKTNTSYECAIKLYERIGFTRNGTVADYYGKGEDLIMYLKELS